MQYPLFQLEDHPQHDATLARLQRGSYGSLGPAVHEVSTQLTKAVERHPTWAFILDVSEAETLGATFLGQLPGLSEQLKQSDSQLVLCGDHHELMHAMRLHKLFPVVKDAPAALTWCETQRLEAGLPATSKIDGIPFA